MSNQIRLREPGLPRDQRAARVLAAVDLVERVRKFADAGDDRAMRRVIEDYAVRWPPDVLAGALTLLGRELARRQGTPDG